MKAAGLVTCGLLALTVLACGRDDIVSPCTESLSIVLSPASTTIPVGGTASFTVRVPDGCGDRPARAFTWSLSDRMVAATASTTDSTVVLTGAGAGHTTVTATAASDTNVKVAGLLTVVAFPPPAAVP